MYHLLVDIRCLRVKDHEKSKVKMSRILSSMVVSSHDKAITTQIVINFLQYEVLKKINVIAIFKIICKKRREEIKGEPRHD